MPNIRGYENTTSSLTPSERGAQAADTAGRRLGGLYNAAAADVRERGKLAAEGYSSRMWPLNYLALQQRQQAVKARAAAEAAKLPPPGTVNFNVVGGSRGSSGGSSRAGGGGSSGGAYQDHGQTSRGAAALTGTARQLATSRNSGVPPVGSAARDRLMQEAMKYANSLYGDKEPYYAGTTSEGGRLVKTEEFDPDNYVPSGYGSKKDFEAAQKWYDTQGSTPMKDPLKGEDYVPDMRDLGYKAPVSQGTPSASGGRDYGGTASSGGWFSGTEE